MPPQSAQDEAKFGHAPSGGIIARYPGVIAFWTVILLTTGAGAGYLQYLGPPGVAAPAAQTAGPAAPRAAATSPATLATFLSRPASTASTQDLIVPAADREPLAEPANDPQAITPGNQADTQPVGAPIQQPLSKLLTPSSINPQWRIPKIAPDDATPMQAYAASQLPSPAAAMLPPNVPKVAVIVAGLGDNQNLIDTAAALPPQISLAIYPYGKNAVYASEEARAAGHETILVLPMPGLLAGASRQQNQATLDWSMSVFQGYAGVTDAFGTAMGGGFMNNAPAKTWLMTKIAHQGLFYVEGDPTANISPFAAGRNADIVIDATDGPADETVKLLSMETAARSQQSSLAVILNPTPDALQILSNWSNTLTSKDLALVPVSALIQPPDIPLPNTVSLK